MRIQLLAKKIGALLLSVCLVAGGLFGCSNPTQASPVQVSQSNSHSVPLSIIAQATVPQLLFHPIAAVGGNALEVANEPVLIADSEVEDDDAKATAKAEKKRLKAEKKAAKAEAKRLKKIKEEEEEAAEDAAKAEKKAAKKAAKEAKVQAKEATEAVGDLLMGNGD